MCVLACVRLSVSYLNWALRESREWRKKEEEKKKKSTAGHAQFANSLFVPDFSQFTHSAHFIQALVEFHVPLPFDVTIVPSGPKLAITWYRRFAIKSLTLRACACLVVFALNTKTLEERLIRLFTAGQIILSFGIWKSLAQTQRLNMSMFGGTWIWHHSWTSSLSCSCCCGSLVGCSL